MKIPHKKFVLNKLSNDDQLKMTFYRLIPAKILLLSAYVYIK